MKIAGRLFSSGIARRLMVCLIAAALLPLAGSALLSLDLVTNMLIEQNHARLERYGEDYANALRDRLLTVEGRLHELSARSDLGAALRDGERARLQREFKGLAIAEASGKIVQIFGDVDGVPPLDAAQVERLGRGATVLATTTGAGGASRVWASAGYERAGAGSGRIVAEIDPAYLWRRLAEPSTHAGICVGDAKGKPLACAREAPPTAPQAFTSPMYEGLARRETFDRGGAAYLASHHSLPFEPEIAGRGWSVVATRPVSDVLAPVEELESMLFAMSGVAILFVAVLGATQIGRSLRALNDLREGLRRVGEKDFSARIDARGNDELNGLGPSFNTMAARLGGEFTALLTLSEIDQAIVSRLDLDRVIETVVMRMRDVVPADFVSIAIVDRNAPAMVRIYTRDQRRDGGLELERCAFTPEDTGVLLAYPDGLWLDRAQAVTPYLAPVAKLGAASLFVLPVVWQNDVVGTVVLGFTASAILSDEERGRARNLGDRVGVAFATAAKDEQLYVQANYDTLTALPNRQYFMDQLARRLAQAQRDPRQFALLVVDLDHFKRINDTQGHEAGDDVLRQTAERLKQCVRETDTVARLGGDEFTIVLPQVKSARDSESVAQHIIESMAAPFLVAGKEQFLNASIGIALYPADGTTAEALLRNADTAMYRAKEGGRGRYVYFEERMNVAALARVSLERELRRAVENNEFTLWYQPQLDLRTGRISGAEALLRWECPGQEMRTPADFIHLAEDTGLIEPIGEWVLREACRQFRAWRGEGIALPLVAVNVSIRQFRQPAFVESVGSILRSTGMAPKCLELEITEGLLHETNIAAATLLEPLHAMGVTFSLDDFGTGYSSLASVKRFPLATIKIDRTFIADLSADDESGSVAAAVIATAHALRKRVVAEGVETERQAAILARLGCDHLQGHFCSRPLDARTFARFFVHAEATRKPVLSAKVSAHG
jgi:diguanylate cyclase (GGDEF)-like protein